jgi:triosephosphate isomerase
MRKKIVAGNWKMNKTVQEGQKLTSEIVNMLQDETDNTVFSILCVPFIHLSGLRPYLKELSHIKLGAQNVNEHESGAYTGEISSQMVKSCGAEYVILGHSERREYFNETDSLILEKVKRVIGDEMIPIYCCGEKLDAREKGVQFDVVGDQLEKSILLLSEEEIRKTIVAYEPVWAIGTGKTASPDQAQEMHAFIRERLSGKFGNELADQIPVLYGGSVKPANARELFANEDVDGGLIGGASLNSRDFVDIVKAYQ